MDSDGDAPFGGAIEFGEDDAGDRGELMEGLRLVEGVLSDGGIEDEERFMRRVGDLFLADAAHFGKLVHQIGFSLQAAGCIDEDDVDAARFGCGEGVEGDA